MTYEEKYIYFINDNRFQENTINEINYIFLKIKDFPPNTFKLFSKIFKDYYCLNANLIYYKKINQENINIFNDLKVDFDFLKNISIEKDLQIKVSTNNIYDIKNSFNLTLQDKIDFIDRFNYVFNEKYLKNVDFFIFRLSCLDNASLIKKFDIIYENYLNNINPIILSEQEKKLLEENISSSKNNNIKNKL